MSNINPALPRDVVSGVIPRFKIERMRVADQFDPNTGLPLYRTMETVELLIPGDKSNAPVKKVNDAIRAQYATEYNAWKKAQGLGEEYKGSGLPLGEWPQCPKEIVAGLAHANVFTVEQLAGLSDSQTQIRGTIGLRKYRDMAIAFVDASRAAAPIAALSQENDALKARLSLIEKQLEQMTNIAQEKAAKVAALESDTPSLSLPDIG